MKLCTQPHNIERRAFICVMAGGRFFAQFSILSRKMIKCRKELVKKEQNSALNILSNSIDNSEKKFIITHTSHTEI